MEVTISDEQGVTIVGVSGDVEAGNAPELRMRLEDLHNEGRIDFVIDLSEVPFMDSSGLGTLVQLYKRVRGDQGEVRLCALQPDVLRVFELVRLDRVFDIFDSRDEALAAFVGAGA